MSIITPIPAAKSGHLANRMPFVMSPHNANLVIRNGRVCAPDGEQRRHKVCIVGGSFGRIEAPLDDPDWEVWAINLMAPMDSEGRLRADTWWDMHQRCAQTDDDMRWISSCPVPIYVPEDLLFTSLNAVRYPIEMVEERLGGYWACTFAYQIAYAMLLGFTDIGLYGVELAFGTERERTVEWANVSYWVGRAEERGINIHLPALSSLARHPARYGIEYKEELKAVQDYTDVMKAHTEPMPDRFHRALTLPKIDEVLRSVGDEHIG